MSLILKAAQSRSSSPAVADALGYSKLCQNLALGAWSRLYLLQNLGLLICGHMLARPSSSVGIDVFSNGEDQETARLRSALSRFRAVVSWRVASRVVSRLRRCLPASMNSLVHE